MQQQDVLPGGYWFTRVSCDEVLARPSTKPMLEVPGNEPPGFPQTGPEEAPRPTPPEQLPNPPLELPPRPNAEHPLVILALAPLGEGRRWRRAGHQ